MSPPQRGTATQANRRSLLLAGAILLLLLLTVGKQGCALAVEERPAVGRIGATDASGAATAEPGPDPIRSVPPDPQSGVVQIVDDVGLRLDGAELWCVPQELPWVDRNVARCLGESAAGDVLVHHADLERATAEVHVLAAYHVDCLPAFVPPGEVGDALRGGTARIVLKRVPVQQFRCIDRQGRPVQGAAVLLSRSGSFEGVGAPAVMGLPGPARDRMMVALTDASGFAQQAVAPGSYRVKVMHGLEHAVAEASVRLPVDLPQQQPIEFKLDRVLVAAVAVVGDDVVATNARFANVTTANAGQGRLAELGELMRRTWEGQNPGRACVVLTGFQKGSGVPVARISLCLARSGWHDLDVEYQPMVAGSQPTIVDVSRSAASSMATMTIGWGYGSELPLVRIRQAGDWRVDNRLVSKLLSQASTLSVPPGEYVLEAGHAADWPFLPRRRLTVRAGERHDVAVHPRDDAAVIRLTVVTPGGSTARDVSVVLEREGRVLQ